MNEDIKKLADSLIYEFQYMHAFDLPLMTIYNGTSKKTAIEVIDLTDWEKIETCLNKLAESGEEAQVICRAIRSILDAGKTIPLSANNIEDLITLAKRLKK